MWKYKGTEYKGGNIRVSLFRVGHISLNIKVEISGFKCIDMDWIQIYMKPYDKIVRWNHRIQF